MTVTLLRKIFPCFNQGTAKVARQVEKSAEATSCTPSHLLSSDLIRTSIEPQRNAFENVPNRLPFVWVGNSISQEDLVTAGHFACRGGSPQISTDKPRAAVRVATSLHHPKAGALETHLPIVLNHQELPVSAQQARKFSPKRTLKIHDVQNAFGNPTHQSALTRKLDAIQARESVGLGNPGRRADIIRSQVLYQEGGVYMDFDRADVLRIAHEKHLKGLRNPETGAPNLQLNSTVDGDIRPMIGYACPKLGGNPLNWYLPDVNNDLIVSVPGSTGMEEYQKEIVRSY